MAEFDIERDRLMAILRKQGITDERVLDAIAGVPRERFVPDEVRQDAYRNVALPIGEGQTISQPYIVAIMTQSLMLTGTEHVLEVGTGTGYQTAVLSRLCDSVISIERIPSLSTAAASRLSDLGCKNVELHTGDGTLGWKPSAPYDVILVTAGAPDVPSPLYNQLRVGGRIVIPVGDEQRQELQIIEKHETGPRIIDAGGCRFVKLIGDAGWETAP